MAYSCTQERFERDITNHQMVVIRNDGVNRHLRFKSPGSSGYWFDLVTWSGVLVINGDMGTHVFSRVPDMFEFFDCDQEYYRDEPDKLQINPGYWSEKLLAIDKCGSGKASIYELDESTLRTKVREYFDDYYSDSDSPIRNLVWEQIENDILAESFSDSSEALNALYRFNADDDAEFRFEECWEWRLETFGFPFIWCCYAIQWGIQKYYAGLENPNE